MKINEKQKVYIRYLLSVLMIAAMTGIAELTNEKEIIFPEIAALLIGGWIANRQPWKTNRISMFFLMSASAVIGIAIVHFIPFSVYGQALLAYGFAAICLIVSKTTMVPMISACVLPVLMQTRSLIYPISVAAMTAIIIFIQFLLEFYGYKEKTNYIPWTSELKENGKKETIALEYKNQIKDWCKRFFIFALLGAYPLLSGEYYFVIPPLIVMYTEFTNPKFHLREQINKTVVLIISAALLGVTGRYLLSITFGLSITATAVIISCLLLLLFHFMNLAFPPAGAIALLPLILNSEGLLWYPIKAAIGCVVLLFAAVVLFKNKDIEEKIVDDIL